MSYRVFVGKKRSVHPPDEWKSQGECRKVSREFFYSDKPTEIKEAIAICNFCQVRNECLDYAIANSEFGVWGGTTERQRRLLIRNRTKSNNP
jgi:WhiB family redox-sensing transcriptional regulator